MACFVFAILSERSSFGEQLAAYHVLLPSVVFREFGSNMSCLLARRLCFSARTLMQKEDTKTHTPSTNVRTSLETYMTAS